METNEDANARAQDTASILVHRRRHAKKADPRNGGGSVRARAFARSVTKSIASELHLPPVSRATTIKRHRSPSTNSWYLRSLSLRAREGLNHQWKLHPGTEGLVL